MFPQMVFLAARQNLRKISVEELLFIIYCNENFPQVFIIFIISNNFSSSSDAVEAVPKLRATSTGCSTEQMSSTCSFKILKNASKGVQCLASLLATHLQVK